MSILKFSNFYQHPSKYASSTYIVGEGRKEYLYIIFFIHRHAFYPRKGDPLYTHYCAHNASVHHPFHGSPFRGCTRPFMLWVPCNRLAYYTILYRAQFQPPCYYWEIIEKPKNKIQQYYAQPGIKTETLPRQSHLGPFDRRGSRTSYHYKNRTKR